MNTYKVCMAESDLYISTKSDLSAEALAALKKAREELHEYIDRHPSFKTAMEPVSEESCMPDIVRNMILASRTAGVGPMAAVAGAVSEAVGVELSKYSDEVIVENGGDIYFDIKEGKTVAVFAGDSPFSMRIGIKLVPEMSPMGMCTSSGTVGHSVSYGNADAVVCLSSSASLSDAAATAVGNRINTHSDIETGLEYAQTLQGICGCMIIIGDKMGVKGDMEICKIK
ncbi:MAG: UPF0280 family protein [Elusimicrobiota bacterium]